MAKNNFRVNRRLLTRVKENGFLFEEVAGIADVFEGHLLHAAGGWKRLTIPEEERIAEVLGCDRKEIFD